MGRLKSFLDGFYLIPNSDRPKWPIEGGFLVVLAGQLADGISYGWNRTTSSPSQSLSCR